MAWRVHLTNQAITTLDVLPGKQPMLIVWLDREQVHLYDLDNGTLLSDYRLPPAPRAPHLSERWQTYLGHLIPPVSAHYLPYVRAGNTDVHLTDDGKLRVYRLSDGRLFMETDGAEEELVLVGGERLIALDLDRALGMFVGLDDDLKLHIYQQNIRVGAFDIGLEPAPDLRVRVRVSRGGGQIYATDGRKLVAVDSGGTVLKTLETHYYVGRIACSPGGGMLITSDMEAGVLRAYKGDTLTLTHQRFAIDLVAAADQVQLLADLPPPGTAISAIAAYNRGVLAFAMSGVVCVTNVADMDAVPRPKALL